MKQLTILIALALSLCVGALAQTPVTGSSSVVEVTTNPGAGQIDIVKIDAGSTFELSFSQIQEVDVTNQGVPNAINSFNNANFQVGTAQWQNDGQVNVTRMDMSASNLAVAAPGTTNYANLNVQISVVDSKGTVTLLGGQAVDVAPGNVIVQFNLNNWPSHNVDNRLNVEMTIVTPKQGSSFNNGTLDLYDGASIYFPSTAQLSGVSNAPVAVSASSSKNVVSFTMSFNATQSTNYDLVWSAQSTGSAASTLSSFLSAIF